MISRMLAGGFILILIFAISLDLAPKIEERINQSLPFGIRAHLSGWHLDPLQPALVIENLSLSQDETFLRTSSLRLIWAGFQRTPLLLPRYRVEIIEPQVTLTEITQGHYRWGPIEIPHHSEGPQDFLWPISMDLSQGSLLLARPAANPTAQPFLAEIHLHYDRSLEESETAHISFKDTAEGTYAIDVRSPGGLNPPFDIKVKLRQIHLTTWNPWIPITHSIQFDSGLFQGDLETRWDPNHPEDFEFDLQNIEAETLQWRSDPESNDPITIGRLALQSFKGLLKRSVYHLEGLSLTDFKSPSLALDQLDAPHVTTDPHPEGRNPESVHLHGLTHGTSHIQDLILEQPSSPQSDGILRFGRLLASKIEGPKLNTESLDLDQVHFDTRDAIMSAASAQSPVLEGSFGALDHPRAQGIRFETRPDRLTIERLDFHQSHTNAFQSGPGETLGIDWDRKERVIKAQSTHLQDASFHRLRMKRVEADLARLDSNSGELSIQRLTTHQDRVRPDPDQGKSLLEADQIALTHFHSNSKTARWGAGRVLATRGHMVWLVHPDNHFEIQGLTSGFGHDQAIQQRLEPQKVWTYEIGQIAIDDSEVELIDLGTRPRVLIPLSRLHMTADDLQSDARDDIDLRVEAQIGSKGHVNLVGRLQRAPLSGVIDLDLRQFRLPLVAPYWDALTRLSLRHGRLDLSGQFHLIPGETTALEFAGDAHFSNFEAFDEQSGQRMLAFKALTFDDVAVSTHPKHFSTRIIDWDQAYLHLALNEKRQLNVLSWFGVEDPSAVPSELKDIKVEATPKDRPPVATVGLLRIRDSRIDYSDKSFSPPLDVTIRDIEGTLRGVSSRLEANTTLNLQGKINRHSPVRLSGDLMPLDYRKHTDLLLSFQGLNLTRFPQYAGRFSGYRIERGKLNLDLRYQIENDTMAVDNRAMIDRLTLGERVGDDRHLLTDIALWLLMDPRGNLDIDLPVYGDLEDPSYDLGLLYVEAISQVFEKIFTTPVGLVGNLIPQDHLAVSVPFAAGESHLSDEPSDALKQIAALYRENEGGTIEITPRSNPNSDRTHLARKSVTQMVQKAYRRELKSNGLPTTEADRMTAEDVDRRVVMAHRHQANLPSAEPIAGWESIELTADEVSEAWDHALEESRISPDLLNDLAEDRADTLRARLMDDYGLPDEWIFLRPAELDAEEEPIAVRIDYHSD